MSCEQSLYDASCEEVAEESHPQCVIAQKFLGVQICSEEHGSTAHCGKQHTACISHADEHSVPHHSLKRYDGNQIYPRQEE